MEVHNADQSFFTVLTFDVVAKEGKLQGVHGYFTVLTKQWSGQFVSDYLRIHRRPLSETLSIPNIDAMRSWTEDCLYDHDDCTRDTFIPTRLIDLGNNDQPIRVIIPSEDDRFSNVQHAPPYLALSYCWGSPHALQRPLKTEIRSLNSRMRGIRLEVVPRTLADSFTVARALGYQFIWIDSL